MASKSVPITPVEPIKPLRQTTIGALIYASTFTIPLNQRPLAWDSSKMSSVWKDLRDSAESGGANFLGFMVFQKVGKGNKPDYTVQDGQQRLMCILSICGILLTNLEKKGGNEQEKADLRNLISPLGKPRLRLDKHHAYLMPLLDGHAAAPPDGGSERPSAKKFVKSFGELSKEISKEFANRKVSERGPWVRELITALDERTFVTAIAVKSQSLALRVFFRLNSGGVPLSAADSVKNLFFLAAERQKIPDTEISDCWDTLLEQVPYAELTTYLRYWALTRFARKVSNKELVETLRAPIDSDPKALLAELVTDAEHLRVWWDGTNIPAGSQDVAEALQLLDQPLLAYPLLWRGSSLHTAKKITDSELRKLAVAIERYIFRELTVRRRKTNEIEAHLAESSKYLEVGSVNVTGAIRVLSGKSDDNDFKDAFATWSERRKKKQFYVVRAIERFLGSAPGASYKWSEGKSRDWEVEHIYPQSKRAGLSVSVNRIGNLVLLERAINGSIQAADFADKKKAYEFGIPRKRGKNVPPSKLSAVVGPIDGKYTPDPSDPTKTQYTLVVDYQKFEEVDIRKRQAELSGLAPEIWKIC